MNGRVLVSYVGNRVSCLQWEGKVDDCRKNVYVFCKLLYFKIPILTTLKKLKYASHLPPNLIGLLSFLFFIIYQFYS